jgi:hypothetical protein
MATAGLSSFNALTAMHSRIIVASFIVLALLLRGPAMYLQPGSADEWCYAVPGLAILSTGIPQLPHVPARNPESVYYWADQALYSEPPIYFYVQALFYSMLPVCYGTARLVSMLAGIMAAILLFHINRHSGGSRLAGLLAAGMFLFSRWFYFPAMSARPDFLCVAFGLAAVYCLLRWRESTKVKWLISTGILIGLGGLTHAFAVVYAVQLAVWSMLISKGSWRLYSPAVLTLTTLAVMAIWLPLIAMYPNIFWTQFSNQYITAHQESPLFRIFHPQSLFWYHWFGPAGMLDHIGPIQSSLVFIPLIYWTVRSSWQNDPLRPICWLVISSIFVTTILVGPGHRVIGYWSFAAGLMFIGTARLFELIYRRLAENFTNPRGQGLLKPAFLLACIAIMLPGSGLKAGFVYLANLGRIEFNAPAFGRRLAESFPSDTTIAVGYEFTLDFIVAGRKTYITETAPFYFPLEEFPCDYLVVSRDGLAAGFPEFLPTAFLRSEGIKDNRFACYAEVYSIRSSPRKVDIGSAATSNPTTRVSSIVASR